MKEVKVRFSEDALAIYQYITNKSVNSKKEMTMLKAILRNIELLKKNPHRGQSINKKRIPKEYVKKYKIKNLYRIELPDFFRMLYTLNDEEIEIIAFVLDIVNHKEYNKKFEYS